MSTHALKSYLGLPVLCLAVALSLFNCKASTDQKRGGCGEFCNNVDIDCREGLVCEQNECVEIREGTCGLPENIRVTCENICSRFERCQVPGNQSNCFDSCTQTIEDWNDNAVNTFGRCLIDDLSCQRLQQQDEATQTCYQRISLPSNRRSICERVQQTFQQNQCVDGRYIKSFMRGCLDSARTDREAIWKDVLDCRNAAQQGDCQLTRQCTSQLYNLE